MTMKKGSYLRSPLPCTNGDHLPARRKALFKGLSLAFASFLPGMSHAQEAPKPTWMEIIGPFYPVEKPTDQDADLTAIAGRTGAAQGNILHLSGRVLARNGAPVPGAVVEIWQANAAGRYAHTGDKNPAPLDQNFEGYARIVTDSEGRYSIKTIKPGAYPVPSGWMRAPHIHFDVSGKVTRLVTAMYFEGEALNEQDRILKMSFNPKSQMTPVDVTDSGSAAGTLRATWDIVLFVG
jgi:protocatechuate 3,4-dioxygenase, beta subunit